MVEAHRAAWTGENLQRRQHKGRAVAAPLLQPEDAAGRHGGGGVRALRQAWPFRQGNTIR